MNTRVRTALQPMKAPVEKLEKEKDKDKKGKQETQRRRFMDSGKKAKRCRSRIERKIALQQDVDKLKKKLRHEENVHRALERAFIRPLGALPRLPPYLPPYTLELLAEVAVLEEEVVRLEEQVVNFRQGLYQEAIYISSSKKTVETASDLYPPHSVKKAEPIKSSSHLVNSKSPVKNNSPSQSVEFCMDPDRNGPSPNRCANPKPSSKKPNSSSAFAEDRRGKENQLNSNSTTNSRPSPQKKVATIRTCGSIEKSPDKKQLKYRVTERGRAEEILCSASDEPMLVEGSGPNKLSEDILKCLLSIFLGISVPDRTGAEPEMAPSVSGSHENPEDVAFPDPYGICNEFGRRDIGPYKHFRAIERSLIDPDIVTSSSFHTQRLRSLLSKLALVDLEGLTHQQKLAFWINTYNSCMMNAILEHGIPASPHTVVSLMKKATINVGGHLLSAMTIEHFILRLPYHSKHTFPKSTNNDEKTARSVLGLDWPEPLVTFALSCGSWSSPAVRVYTAAQVENELETAKSDYLQAAIGISLTNKFAIPKLLDWYLLDFAKDVESLMDWICLQLPSGLRNEAVKCLERGRKGSDSLQFVQVMPYEFSFRYLLAT